MLLDCKKTGSRASTGRPMESGKDDMCLMRYYANAVNYIKYWDVST